MDDHVYLLVSEAGPVKVGISRDPARRATQCSHHGFGKALLLKSWPTPLFAEIIEARVHYLLSDRRVKGEWFRASAEEALDAIEQVRRDMLKRPFPQAHCDCPAINVLTCTEAKGEDRPCDCECHPLWSQHDER